MVRALKDVVKQTIELDKAFTRLQMVTKATDAEINKMKSDYIALAKEMHVSLSTVTDAAEAWLRTGMNAADATEALRASTILATDAFMEGGEATQYLVAAQKAYGLEANELLGVVDKLTTLDTKAATTAADLGEALSMSASSSGLAGISMDKYLAILATASETTQQSASNIGNAWKTILARLQQVKLGSALDEEGQDISNVDKLLKEYGIDLMKTTSNLENMEALLDELGGNWKRYTAAQKSEIATVVAGTRQRDKLIATLNNYDRVMELTAESTNSAGSAMEKFNIYADSTEAKLNDLKTAWTKLADATLNSDIVEWFVKFGTKALDATAKAGGLVPVLMELAGVMVAIKAASTGNVLGIALGAGAVVGGAIYQAVDAIKTQKEERIAEAKKEAEAIKQSARSEIKDAQDLMKKYLELNNVLEKTKEQKEELVKVSEQLADTLGIEKETLAGSVLEFNEAVNAYYRSVQETYQKKIEDANKKLQESMDEIEEKAKDNITALTILITLGTLGITSLINDESGKNIAQKWAEDIERTSEQTSGALKVTEEYSNAVTELSNAFGVANDAAKNLLDKTLDIDKWDRSEQGAKELANRLSDIKSILDDMKLSATDENRDDIEALVEYFSVVMQFYSQELETFQSTDHILTEYYDKRLKDLKEQKELEDELAKQKEKQEKLESAELKKQEALLEVEKARAELAKAKEKRIQVFRMGKGLVYEEDTESIANAQEDLTKALDNYASAVKDYDKVFSELYGTATEQLSSAVEELERVYGYVLLQNPAVREYFQTPEKREEFMALSFSEQLSALLEFIVGAEGETAIKEKVYSEIAGLGEKAVEEFGLSGEIPDTEAAIEARGAKVRGGVFGTGEGGAETVSNYLDERSQEEARNRQKEAFEMVQAVIDKWHLREGDRGRWGQVFKSEGVLDEFWLLSDEQRNALKGYHSGGIVGQSAFKSDTEMYAKLLKGEIVLPQSKFNNIIEKVRSNTTNNSSVMNIGNISLPNVTDTDSFVNELQKISYAKA